MKLSNKTDQELKDIISAVLHEQAVRRRLDASPEKIENAIAEYQKASGRGEGEPWEQPTGPLNAYRKGAVVEHEGEEWVSTHGNNVHSPGVSGWRLKPEIDPETGEEIPPPFRRPSGAHDAYELGDRITWTDGKVYEAVRDGVDWDPGNAPQDWRLVEAEPEPAPEPPEDDEDEPVDPDEPGDQDEDEPDDEDDEPTEPEPEPDEPALPEWKVGVDYQPGDRFIYDGAEYTVLQAHTSAAHWPPDAVASLYERQ